MKILSLILALFTAISLASCAAGSSVTPVPSIGAPSTSDPSIGASVDPSLVPSAEQPEANFSNVDEIALYETATTALRAAPYYRVEGEGKVENSLSSQDMVVRFEKDGDSYTNLSLSSGFVNKATEIVSTPAGVTVRQGKYDKKNGTASYGAPTRYTEETFSETWGGESTFPYCYLINAETVVEKEGAQTAPNAYTVTLQLDPNTATAAYAKRMQKSGDVSRPDFSSVRFTFTVDGSGRFTSVIIEERYTVTVLFRISCENKITHYFNYTK